jgi:hypothetical protein
MCGYNEGCNDQYAYREAHHVAEMLDRGNIGVADQMLRNDLYQMNPRDQHFFLQMINSMERKGFGADLQVIMLPDGRETYSIVPPPAAYGYGDRDRYPCPDRQYQVQYPYQQMPYERPMNMPQVIVEPQRPDPGAALVEGLAIGVGAGLGSALINRAFGGEHRNYYEGRRHR